MKLVNLIILLKIFHRTRTDFCRWHPTWMACGSILIYLFFSFFKKCYFCGQRKTSQKEASDVLVIKWVIEKPVKWISTKKIDFSEAFQNSIERAKLFYKIQSKRPLLSSHKAWPNYTFTKIETNITVHNSLTFWKFSTWIPSTKKKLNLYT